MSRELETLVVKLAGDASGYNKMLSDAGKQANAAGKRFGGLKKALGTGLKVAGGLAAVGIGGVAFAMRDSIGLAREQINVEKQLDAVLKSTGGAAGLTAKEIKDMASELQGVTNYGDEATLAGQNMLLTFTNIGKDVFPNATEMMLDMSQALGQDLKSSAVQLGKALNDPVAGVSALSRVGVTFTEQQKDQIKAMVEAGDVAGAQGLILAELGKEFGGSARAMADPAIQLQNAWGDFKEQVGAAIIPVLNDLAQRALPIVTEAINKMPEAIEWLRGVVESAMPAISTAVGYAQVAFAWFKESGIPAIQAFSDKVRSVIDFLKPIITSLGATVGTDATDKFAYLKDWLDTNMPKIQQIIETVVGAMTTFWTNHGDKIVELVDIAFNTIQTITDTVLKVVLGIVEFWLNVFTGDWEGAKDAAIGIVDDLWEGIKGIFGLAVDAIKVIFSDVNWQQIGEDIMNGIINGINNGIQWIKDAARNAANSALNAAKSALGIHSPSSVMAEKVGKPMAQGVGAGFEKALDSIGATLGGMTNSLQPITAMSGSDTIYLTVTVGPGATYQDGRNAGRGIIDQLRASGQR